MLCVRAPSLEKHLARLSQITGKTKSHYMRLALEALFTEIYRYEKHFSFEASLLPEFEVVKQECDQAT